MALTSTGPVCVTLQTLGEGADFLPAVGIFLSAIGHGYWCYQIYQSALPISRIRQLNDDHEKVKLIVENVKDKLYLAIELAKSSLHAGNVVRLESQLSDCLSRTERLVDIAEESSTEIGLTTAAIFNLRLDHEAAIEELRRTHNLEIARLRTSLDEQRHENRTTLSQIQREFRSIKQAMQYNRTETAVRDLMQTRDNLPQQQLENDLADLSRQNLNPVQEASTHVFDLSQPTVIQRQMGVQPSLAAGNRAAPQDVLADFYIIDADQPTS